MIVQQDSLEGAIKLALSKMARTSLENEVCPSEEILAAFFEGTLANEERDKIEAHFVFCRRCIEALISYAEISESQSERERLERERLVPRYSMRAVPKEEAYSDAKEALAIDEEEFGPDHPVVAKSLGNLAKVYCRFGDYAKAEPLYQRALALNEKELGVEHPGLIEQINKLAEVYSNLGDYAKTEPLYQRALALNEKKLGVEQRSIYLSSIRAVTSWVSNSLKRKMNKKAKKLLLNPKKSAALWKKITFWPR